MHVMDRGHDENKMFLKLDSMGQDYVIRLTAKRRLLYHNKSMKPEANALKMDTLHTADPLREKVSFCYYWPAKGISGILNFAREGVRLWFRTRRPAYRQLCLKLII